MASRAQLHAELIGFLRQHCTVRDHRHLVLLAWMVTGPLLSETVCFNRWKTHLPLAHCLAANRFSVVVVSMVARGRAITLLADRTFPCDELIAWFGGKPPLELCDAPAPRAVPTARCNYLAPAYLIVAKSLGSHNHAPQQAAVCLAFHQPAANQLREATSAGRRKKAWGRAGWL